nr:hypothetical protein BaRGS_005348 [Batillaria attramentaria]
MKTSCKVLFRMIEVLWSEKKGYWSHRNTKILLAVVVLCVLVAIGLIIALAATGAQPLTSFGLGGLS